MKARQNGTHGRSVPESNIDILEEKVFFLGEQNADLEMKIEGLIEVNEEQRKRLVEASLLRTRISELELKLADSNGTKVEAEQ